MPPASLALYASSSANVNFLPLPVTSLLLLLLLDVECGAQGSLEEEAVEEEVVLPLMGQKGVLALLLLLLSVDEA